MTNLLYAELVKLRTTRTFIALAGVAVGLAVLITVSIAALSEPTKEDVLTDVFNSDTSSLFILILAVIGISGEWRHRTITSSLLAAPHRVRFLLAKTLAFAAAGVLLSLLIATAVTIVGMVILTARDLPTPDAGELLAQHGRNAMVAAMLGALGVGIGALVRNQVVAIVGVLIFSFALEPALIALAPDVARWGPFLALPTAAADIPPDAIGLDDFDLVAQGLAVLAMLAWISAFFAAGAALLVRRDLT